MNEPTNKRMDELMKAWAQKRRPNSESALGPAARERLQREVSRVYPEQTASRFTWLEALRRFWPHLAAAAATCVVLGAVLFSTFRNREGEEQLARAEPRVAEREFAEGPSGASRKLAEQSVAMDSSIPQEAREAPGPDLAYSAAAKSEASDIQEAAQIDEAVTRLQRKSELSTATAESRIQSAAGQTAQPQARDALAKTPPPPGVVALPPNRFDQMTNLGAALRRHFATVTNMPVANSSNMPVLRLFSFEQLGSQIQLTDADGSQYRGVLLTNGQPAAVLTTATADRALQTPAMRARAATSAPALTGPVLSNALSYQVRAEGSNRTLGVHVLFTGDYFAVTNAPAGIAGVAAAVGQARPATAPRPSIRAVIAGTAIINGTNAVGVRAVSADP